MTVNTRIHGWTESRSVTPNDTVDDTTKITSNTAPSSENPAALWVGGSGDVAVVYASGVEDVIPAVAAGVAHACQFTHIKVTGTTATDIRALFQ